MEGSGLLRRVIKTLDLEHNQSFLQPQQGKPLTVWQNVQKMFGYYRLPQPEQTAQFPDSNKDNKLKLNEADSANSLKETERLAPLVSALKKNLTVQPVKDNRTNNKETRLIDISFTHQDPVVTAKITNTIGELYVLQNLEQKIKNNASASDFLQKRVAELQSSIRQGEERLINYAKNNQVVSPDANQNMVAQRYAELNTKLGQAENDRIAAQTAYQAALQNQMRAATDQSKDQRVVALESKLSDLQQRLAQLKTEYTDEWYEVIQTKKQIEGVENQLAAFRKQASNIQISTLQERLNEAIGRERELRNAFNSQREEIIKQNEASINYKIIRQEIDTNKTLLDALLQRSREYEVVLNDTPNNVLVVDRALVPNSPVGPERIKNVILAFLISLAVGCGLAFLIDWLDDSVHNSDEIERELELPLLATIPLAPLSLGKRLFPKSISLARRNKSLRSYPNLAIFEKPQYLEPYLHLRTHLTLSATGNTTKSILVTSSEEGEGKTITALNLATSLAKDDNNILLIDADLRCPRLHIVKGLSNQYGLTTLLTLNHIEEQLLDKIIQKDYSQNINILTAGQNNINPANLLGSERMRNLMVYLSTRYSHIIIDSPPVIYFADSTILSTMTDSVIIVVRDNVSCKRSVLKAKKILKSVGANIVGMVLNGIPRNSSHYKKYKYYESGSDFPRDQKYQTLELNKNPRNDV
jgi:capsular exopolysaccharide synthesis family protein